MVAVMVAIAVTGQTRRFVDLGCRCAGDSSWPSLRRAARSGIVLGVFRWRLSSSFWQASSRISAVPVNRLWPSSDTWYWSVAGLAGRAGGSLPIIPHGLADGYENATRQTCLDCHAVGAEGATSIPHDVQRQCGEDGEECWDGRVDCLGCHRYDPALGGPTSFRSRPGLRPGLRPVAPPYQRCDSLQLPATDGPVGMAEAAAPAPLFSRVAVGLLFFTVVPLALLAFVSHLEQADIPTLVQGPLVVDPTLGDRLATVLSADFIRWSQLAIHIAGFATFAGLAALIAFRSQETVSLVASAMLVAVGASLFAPLAGLQGLPGRFAGLGWGDGSGPNRRACGCRSRASC